MRTHSTTRYFRYLSQRPRLPRRTAHAVLYVAMILAGCERPDPTPMPGPVVGAATFFESPNRILIEIEPNNDADSHQILTIPSPDAQVTVVGLLEASNPQFRDIFRPTPDIFRPTPTESGIVVVNVHAAAVNDLRPSFRVSLLDETGAVLDTIESTGGAAQTQFQSDESCLVAIESETAFAYRAVFTLQNTTATAKQFTPNASGAPIARDILAVFRSSTTPPTRDAIAESCETSVIDASPSGLCRLLPRNIQTDANAIHAAIQCLSNHPETRSVEPNDFWTLQRAPNDPLFPNQWNLNLIQAESAWDVSTGSDDILTAVIDSGARFDHPDLANRFIPGYDFVSEIDVSLDGDGRDPNATDPGDRPSNPQRSTFHGTRVAGVIAATANNALGVTGATWSGKIMPIRAFGAGGIATNFDLSEAIRYAAGLENASGATPNKRADIINLSLARSPGSPVPVCIDEAIRSATDRGVIVVAAAGNNATSTEVFPAAFANVIGVAAVNRERMLASYSNFGSWVDLVAPGGEIDPDDVLSTAASSDGETVTLTYDGLEGTSIACPHVSAAAALMLSVNPNLSPDQVRLGLLQTATDLGAFGTDDLFGAGLLNLSAAVRRAEALSVENATPPRMILGSTAIDLSDERDRYAIDVLNVGGGLLDVAGVEVESGDDAFTLITAGGSANATIAQVELAVNRDALGADARIDRLFITSLNSEPDYVEILAPEAGATAVTEPLFAVAIDAESGLEVARNVIDPGESEFSWPTAPKSHFIVIAGTDRDGDGVLCESEDICGLLRRADAPRIVDPADATLRHLGFAIFGNAAP